MGTKKAEEEKIEAAYVLVEQIRAEYFERKYGSMTKAQRLREVAILAEKQEETGREILGILSM